MWRNRCWMRVYRPLSWDSENIRQAIFLFTFFGNERVESLTGTGAKTRPGQYLWRGKRQNCKKYVRPAIARSDRANCNRVICVAKHPIPISRPQKVLTVLRD